MPLREPVFGEISTSCMANKEEWLEHILREKVEPPIKGDITPGKLKWRGIRLAVVKGSDYTEQTGKTVYASFEYVEQRGKPVYPMLLVNITTSGEDNASA